MRSCFTHTRAPTGRWRATVALVSTGALMMMSGFVVMSMPETASATPGSPHKTSICHRTASDTNPYVFITVDDASLDAHYNNLPGHPAKAWKSDGVFRGVAHKAGDLKYDYPATTAADCADFGTPPDEKLPEAVPVSQEEATCELGYRSRTGTTYQEYVWDDEANEGEGGWVLEPASEWETVWNAWSAYRPLTDAEYQRLGCQPKQPEPVVAPLKGEQMSCEAGVEVREGTQTTTYVWNAATRTYDPVVGPEVWGDWTFVRDLTNEEFEQLGCRPDQPEPLVVPLSGEQMSCDNGVEQREGTRTTTYVWNPDTRTYDPVVGEDAWGAWATVRDLTAAEALELDCIKGEETVVPEPTEKPDRTPTVLGTEAVVPTEVDAGLAGLPDAGSPAGGLPAQLLVGAGLLLIVAGGWVGLGRNTQGAHRI